MYPIVKNNGSHSLLTHNNTTVMIFYMDKSIGHLGGHDGQHSIVQSPAILVCILKYP